MKEKRLSDKFTSYICGVMAILCGIAVGIQGIRYFKPINSGIVVYKKYEPDTTFNVLASTSQVAAIQRVMDDEDYIIYFAKEESGKLKTRRIFVTEEIFSKYTFGDSISIDEIVCETRDPYRIVGR